MNVAEPIECVGQSPPAGQSYPAAIAALARDGSVWSSAGVTLRNVSEEIATGKVA